MTDANDKKKKTGRGATIFLTLFGLPFLAGGGFACWMVFDLLSDYYGARRWVQTPAEIRFLDLERHTGDDSTTYKVVCHYIYHHDHRKYEGTRVGLLDMSDNLGSWHQDTHRRLERAYKSESSVFCYVDPGNPSQAVIDRDLRFGALAFLMVFATVFTSVGGGLMLGGFYAGRTRREKAHLVALHEKEPWLHRADWAAGIISPRLSGVALAAWIIAIFWNLISSPILFVLPRELFEKGNYPALIGLIFPLVGLGLLIFAIRATARRRKFGQSSLQLTTLPGVVGGHLRGHLIVAGRIEGLQRLDIELVCIRTYHTGSGKNRTTRHDTIWSAARQYEVAVIFGQTEIRVPLDFQIPYDCRPHDDRDANDAVAWQLQVRGSVPGVDLALDFDVPVFRTAASDRRIGDSPAQIEQEEALIAADEPPPEACFRIGLSDDGHEQLTISAWPGAGFFLLILLMQALFTGVAVFSFFQIRAGNWFMLIFLVAFGAVSLLLACLLWTLLGSYRVTLAPGQIRVLRRVGPFRSLRTIAASDVMGVESKECASSGRKRWYDVRCRTAPRRHVQVAANVPSHVAARWLVRRIEDHVSCPDAARPFAAHASA